jgi:hypothetical protein
MNPEIRLDEFETSNPYLHDTDALNRRFQEDGYLFFRRVLDAEEVRRVKQDFVRILQEQGVAQSGCAEPVWTGTGLEHIDDTALYRLKSYDDLLESRTTVGLIERLFEGPVFRYRNTDIRFALPYDERHLTPPHQDHFFIRQTDQFRTAWVPLMAIGQDAGPLAIAKQSHRMGLLDHVEHATAYSYIFRGRKQRGVPMDRIDGPWLTTDYVPGDLLLFHSLSIHRALPNRSDRIRLSIDGRFQPLAMPRTWQSEQTILGMREYRKAVQRLAMAEGATEPVFESLLIEMMKRGLDAEAENVRALMAELSTVSPQSV